MGGQTQEGGFSTSASTSLMQPNHLPLARTSASALTSSSSAPPTATTTTSASASTTTTTTTTTTHPRSRPQPLCPKFPRLNPGPRPAPAQPSLIDRTMPPPSFVPRKRKLAPALSSPSPGSSPTPDPDADADDDDEDGEYAPARVPSSSAQAKRGKQAPSGKSSGRPMSREQLRKANHSMIERRRREKINAALAELRDMVPDLGGETKGGEFKLEVLERTVAYMKDLRGRIAELESQVSSSIATTQPTTQATTRSHPSPTRTGRGRTTPTTSSTTANSSPEAAPPKVFARPQTTSKTPPSPSLSPDPNETEPEQNLPPAYTLSARPPGQSHTPTIASLLHTANSTINHTHNHSSEANRHISSRPAPGPQANNPTLYLPFPTPSPTSPFLTYHSSSTASSNSSGPPEPSPFLAPLHNISLFGGALNLDAPHGLAPGGKDIQAAEEAANVLLAFSSPDTLKPIVGAGLGMTPKMIPALPGGMRERRLTLESEEFVLDGGVAEERRAHGPRSGVVGKTARDILKM